jgi:hypothetical protein
MGGVCLGCSLGIVCQPDMGLLGLPRHGPLQQYISRNCSQTLAQLMYCNHYSLSLSLSQLLCSHPPDQEWAAV